MGDTGREEGKRKEKGKDKILASRYLHHSEISSISKLSCNGDDFPASGQFRGSVSSPSWGEGVAAELSIFGIFQIKTGAPCRSERLAKYNQLMR